MLIALHLDHGKSYEDVKKCVDAVENVSKTVQYITSTINQ